MCDGNFRLAHPEFSDCYLLKFSRGCFSINPEIYAPTWNYYKNRPSTGLFQVTGSFSLTGPEHPNNRRNPYHCAVLNP